MQVTSPGLRKVFLLLLLTVMLALFAGAGTVFAVTPDTDMRITTNGKNQYAPAIYGNTIVWVDERHGSAEIYKYDLLTGTETRITNDQYEQAYPSIYGDKVVWDVDRSGYRDVILYDLTSGKATNLTPDTPGDQTDPAIYGDKIVWQDNRHGYWDIYIYNTVTEAVYRLEKPGGQILPAIYENKVVWQDNRHGKWEIYLYDISTNTEERITNDNLDQYYPAIYGNTIVWEQWNNGKANIFQYDLGATTPIATPVSSAAGNQFDPAIYENMIVWEDNRAGNWDIYLYDGTEKQITRNTGGQYFPAIFNNRIVWTDDRNWHEDIYINDTMPPVVTGTAPAKGAAGVTVNTAIKITFNEAVARGSAFSGITLKSGSTVVNYTYQIAGNMLTLTPYANLAYSTGYTVTLPVQAVQDLAGNGLAGEYSFDFTTASSGGGGGGGGSSDPGTPGGTLSIAPAATPAVSPFVDVPDNYWAVNEIVYLYNNKIVSGFPGNRFLPTKPITRGELAVIMAKALKLAPADEGKEDFSDVSRKHWAFKEIQATTRAGVMIGYGNGQFKPDILIARQELVQVIIKALHYSKGAGQEPNLDVLNRFNDKDKISFWAVKAVAEAVETGLVQGVKPDEFGPHTKAVRDQVAVLVYRLVKKIEAK